MSLEWHFEGWFRVTEEESLTHFARPESTISWTSIHQCFQWFT